MNVTWSLAYSGSTADKLLLAGVLGTLQKYDTMGTEFEKFKAQRAVEVARQYLPSSFS
jgi:hypothetical protein